MIRVERFWVVYNSTTMEAVNPEYLSLTREKIEEYMKDHPMPEDPAYSKEELIEDLTKSSGFYRLPDNTKEETREYVAELLNALI